MVEIDDPIRLTALASYGILDTMPEEGFDDVVQLARQLCDAPVSLVSLVTGSRQWFKARSGISMTGTALDASVCAHALAEPDLLVVEDMTRDPRTKDNPLVTGEPFLRFYAAAPLRTASGAVLGTLCVIDMVPRPAGLTQAQADGLRRLARQVVNLLELRKAASQREAALAKVGEVKARKDAQSSESRYRSVVDSITDFALIVTDRDGQVTDWNTGAERILGWSRSEMRGHDVERIFTPEDRAVARAATEMRMSLEQGRAPDERWHLKKNGERFWASGEMMPLRAEDGDHLGFVKVLRDRTAEHLAGQALKAAEARLRESEEHLHHTVEMNPAVAWTCDPDGNITSYSDRWLDLTGQQPGEPDDSGWIKALHPDDVATTTAVFEDCLASGEPVDVDYRIRVAATGEYRWMRARAHPRRGADGKIERWYGLVEDIHDRKGAEAALRESEARFRVILETIEAAFAIVEVKFDADDRPINYRFLEANPAFAREAGVDLRGKWVTEFAPDLEPFWFETYGRVAKTREPASFENYAEAFKRWFDVRAVPVGDPADRQIAIIFNDVTARRDAEERLRESEALARANIERVQLALGAGAIIGTWHCDLPTNQFSVDEGFARSFGLDPALGREGIPLAEIVASVHPDDQAGLAAAMDEAIRRGGAFVQQYRTRRADGSYRWLEANGRVDHGSDGTPLSFPGVLIDVEERRAIEAERDRATAALRALNETLEQRVAERTTELMRAEEALRQSQKMEAVGQLTGGLAHDFNNLLAGISGSLELMNNRVTQGRFTDLEKYMVAAQGAAKRAAALTHRLLAFSRRQTLEPKATDVNALVSGMLDLIRRTVGPSIAVTFAETAGLWSALVDPSQLENALLNLCINARDAMPDGGRITIEAANRQVDMRQAAARDMPDGKYLVLSVSDDGSGMPPEVIARAFEPFFTTKPLGQGTGLGLSMIYGFARQSGGQVRIHSVMGEGTTISIYLPRHVGSAEVSEAAPQEALMPVAEAGETVLVVDDEPTVRMLAMDVLSDLGYRAIEAADGAGGLHVLQSDARVDLLVTDVGLPGGMNGRQMADAARVGRPDLKVLFITGFAEAALFGNGQLEPGMAVLTKPFGIEDFAGKIRRLIER